MKENFQVSGMTCAACVSHVEKSVQSVQGVSSVSVNLFSGRMVAEYDASVTPQMIIAAVEKGGYGAKLASEKETAKGSVREDAKALQKKEQEDLRHRLIVSAVFLILLMYISMGSMHGLPQPSFLSGTENAMAFAFTQFLLVLPIIWKGLPFYRNGFRALWNRAPSMDSLIAVGSAASMIYGIYAIYAISHGFASSDMELVHQYHMDLYFEGAGMILTLVTLGKLLESRSKGRTGEAVERLLDLAPKTTHVERGGEELEILTEEVLVGDVVVIRPGESIPVDGICIYGNAALDESAVTGESIPVEKNPGDTLIAGTINKTGFIKMEARKVGENTTLAEIARLVEEAGASKAPIAHLADKIAGVFVPVVMLIALITAAVWLILGQDFSFALSRSIGVLVISCPCALGLATPVAIMVGTGVGAQHGILCKTAAALQRASEIDTVLLDKTGTLTTGTPVVDRVICEDENALLMVAASLEHASEHPLAEAICSYAEQKNIPLLPADSFRTIPGQGVSAVLAEKACYAGNERMLAQQGVENRYADEARALADEGRTVLYIVSEQQLLGLIAVYDPLKESSSEAVRNLRQMGIKVMMITGDNSRTADAIGRKLELDGVFAQVMPTDKERKVAELQAKGSTVMMVGDGINDAPALSRADVGMAIGAGTDIAIESADIVLMKSDLADAITAIRLSARVVQNIRQNLFWAFFYNCIGIPVAAGVLYAPFNIVLSPMIAAAAMSMSSVFVVTNALRLRFFDKNKSVRIRHKKRKEVKTMEKTLIVDGMMCMHCSGRVEKALNAIEGVSCQVDLENKKAVCQLSKAVDASVLVKAVEDAGYTVLEVL